VECTIRVGAFHLGTGHFAKSHHREIAARLDCASSLSVQRGLILLQLLLCAVRRSDSPFVSWLAQFDRIGPAHYVAAATIIGLGATLMAPRHALSDVDSTAL
jgi:hypothetical protein